MPEVEIEIKEDVIIISAVGFVGEKCIEHLEDLLRRLEEFGILIDEKEIKKTHEAYKQKEKSTKLKIRVE
jgi:predicted nucleotidyltransferase